MSSRKKISMRRSAELKRYGERMRLENSLVLTGVENANRISSRIREIKSIIGCSDSEWRDWKWHIDNRIDTVSRLQKIIELTDDEKNAFRRLSGKFRWAISPYYASLIDPDDRNCPIRMQSVPSIEELLDSEQTTDPMGEGTTSPAPGITRRYPDRLIINVTNQCPMFCRHCQRRRRIGQRDLHTSDSKILEALEYIRSSPEIRDVLITGGDPLMLDDDHLNWLLAEIDDIHTVEIKRIGTRCPVTLPYRITPELCKMLSKHHPLFVNTQFNHPREITKDSAKACDRLTRSGIQMGNQAVLLAGVNNHVVVQRKLNQSLLRIRVRPYYLFHCKTVKGISHFRTSIDAGIEIIENLRGHTSGLAVPHFVVNAPGGLGKVALSPNYVVSSGKGYVIIRTWEMKTVRYENPIRKYVVKLPEIEDDAKGKIRSVPFTADKNSVEALPEKVIDDIQSNAELWRKYIASVSHTDLDYDLESLRRLDELIDEGIGVAIQPGKPISQEDLSTLTVTMGAFVGEVLVRALNCEWVIDRDAGCLIHIVENGVFVNVYERVVKRLKGGKKQSLYGLVTQIEREIQRKKREKK
jgi:glutamate 2,3-aminomutase